MKKSLLYIISILVLSSLVFYYIYLRKDAKKDEGFTRNIINTHMKLKNAYELPGKGFAFIGQPGKAIKLHKMADYLNFYQIDYNLKNLDTVPLKITKSTGNKTPKTYKDVLDSLVYFSDSQGNISIFNEVDNIQFKFNGSSINSLQVISPTAVIVRMPTKKLGLHNRSIAKLILSPSVSISKEYHLPDKKEGYFTNDGILLYDNSTARLFYMYYYRGEFLSLDSNLNFQYVSKTIDTVSNSHIQSTVEQSKNSNASGGSIKITTSSPTKFINGYITANNKKVYIYSLIKSQSDTKSDFAKNQVIDVYKTANGEYFYSFYIPKYNGEKLRQFKIQNRLIIAIYEKSIVTYVIDNV